MRHSQNYNLPLPERVQGRNDAADIDDLTRGLESIDGILKGQDDEDKRLNRDKLDKISHNQHKLAETLDHPDSSVTDAKLGNRSVLHISGTLQTLLTAIGNAIKAIAGTSSWNEPPPTTLTVTRGHLDSRANPHGVTAAQVGLGSVDNTTDLNKPVSTAQQAAIYAVNSALTTHSGDAVRHLTAAERSLWNSVGSKADTAAVLTRTNTAQYTPTASYHPATKQYVDDRFGQAGGGDMLKSTYDSNNSGVVDNAERVGGLTVQTAVPAGAKFTDTVYSHPGTHPASMITGLPTSLPANGGTSAACSGNAATATRATTAATADNATKAYGKSENALSVSYAASAGNADMVDGVHGWNMITLNQGGASHGSTSWLMKCQFDGSRFLFSCGDGSIATRVNYADVAGNADTVDGFHVAGKGTAKPGSLGENALYFVYE